MGARSLTPMAVAEPLAIASAREQTEITRRSNSSPTPSGTKTALSQVGHGTAPATTSLFCQLIQNFTLPW